MPPKAKPKNKRQYNLTETGKVIKDHRIAKQNGTLPALTDDEKSYNDKLIAHSLKVVEISQKANISEPESLRDCFMEYLKLCQSDGFRIGNVGACSALGISYKTLYAWSAGTKRSDDPRYKQLATLISSICSTSREQMINDSKINPVIGIFWQRNFDGLRNDTEQQQDNQNISDNDNILSASEYREKYGKLLEE